MIADLSAKSIRCPALWERVSPDTTLVVEDATLAAAFLEEPTTPASWLPSGETRIERLVRESRAARRRGQLGAEREGDEVRLEATG